MLLTCLWYHIFALCLMIRNCPAVKNDATENVNAQVIDLAPDTPSNISMNQARNGGRQQGSAPRKEQGEMGCRELRSTKYISDGQCTSLNPVKELVCAGECLPAHLLPNWIGGGQPGKYWSRRQTQEWRCVIDRTRTQRIRLQCQDGSSRTYKITVVTSCKCKRYSRQHNDSGHKSEAQAKEQAPQVSRRRKDQRRSRLSEDWPEEQPEEQPKNN
ncbi:sclerostin domain-containing protein 1b [Hypomesus transpacificus]|uniref:sclerostin domain-containing protein 1b n=1 Tax=Hypomesus transpacificus TaxID=137520 RepID=UPI001F07AACE|nr:sclerostin domain-containing protein 1b [Hypomesus transpacificus]